MSYDAEAIEQERFDADMEMADLEAAGRSADRARRRMLRLRSEGRLLEAARACRHGWGYPLASLAAKHENDPRAGEVGVRCLNCGSVLSGFPHDGPVDVLHPCELTPAEG